MKIIQFSKKTTVLVLSFFLLYLLTGCINSGGPIYVESILVYENDELLMGNYKYFDGNVWVNYDNKKITKEKVYYSVDVKGENIKVVFNVYAPNTIVSDIKIVTNINLDYNTNNTLFIRDEFERDYKTFRYQYQFEFDNGFNAITVSGFATSDGLKYMGSKDKESNFVLYGVHFNLLNNN